jgi:putative ABC transport system permease protein
LPEALEKLDLTQEERDTLTKLLSRPLDTKRPAGMEPLVAELTIRGVVRPSTEEETKARLSWMNLETDLVVSPHTAVTLFSRLPNYRERGFNTALIEVDDIEHVKEVRKQVDELGLSGYCLLEQVEVERFIYLLIFSGMSLIATIALGVSALGISNTMLMGVLERVREIGVMKAVGAGEGTIQLLFLVEGLLIGLVGGSLGLLLAWGLSFPGDAWARGLLAANTTIKLKESVFVFPLWLTLGGPTFAGIITTLAAVYPARRAAMVNTVEALRHE